MIYEFYSMSMAQNVLQSHSKVMELSSEEIKGQLDQLNSDLAEFKSQIPFEL